MNVTCPECATVYRIDPARVPAGGIAARCRECDAVFRVQADEPARPGETETAATVGATAGAVQSGTPESPAEPPAEAPAEPPVEAPAEPIVEPQAERAGASPGPPSAPAFGPQDPQTRARRLARALVSDIKVYNPDKWEESRQQGSLRKEFRDEILKSWDEYVEQVGEQIAKKTPYFRDALNEILAGGERVF